MLCCRLPSYLPIPPQGVSRPRPPRMARHCLFRASRAGVTLTPLRLSSRLLSSPLCLSRPSDPSPPTPSLPLRLPGFPSTARQRTFSTSPKMAGLEVSLTAPNGKKFSLPTGLFINNEFVKSSSGAQLTSINPT